MKGLFKVVFVLTLLTGCSSTDDILCETGPVGLTFDVVNETTGENLFVNGLYEENEILIEDSKGENVDFDFESDRTVVNVLLGWETKSDVYTVSIGEEIEFDIVFTLLRTNGRPCSSTKLTDLEIEGATYEVSETTGELEVYVSSVFNESSDTCKHPEIKKRQSEQKASLSNLLFLKELFFIYQF